MTILGSRSLLSEFFEAYGSHNYPQVIMFVNSLMQKQQIFSLSVRNILSMCSGMFSAVSVGQDSQNFRFCPPFPSLQYFVVPFPRLKMTQRLCGKVTGREQKIQST
mmetsp:Transcript_11920/g.42971  ORF Transcript_11920/g.42971 Transcript_11920/m.42971 type:complete len:106 (-) Transcript_11920:2132-2449(-)